jgi:serine/threonine protein kinase/Flp pilus assembly protein TadD
MPKAQDDDLVMTLVEQALSQPPDSRENYVRTACEGDTELFSQVWDYVRWDHRMQDFLLEPLFPAFREHRFEPGDLLADRFRIVREVAQGGMGIVYEAQDERLGRRIALKCAKSGFRKRLPPEVRHASDISHPNVCKIFEIHTASTARGEIDFLTMEFLDGETLSARLSRERLPEAEARAIGRQICAGLAEAHRIGVVHGDLKSNNVILAEDAGGGVRAVITDFGLARKPFGPAGDKAGSWANGAAGWSEAGGTPDYMAPELWKGEKATTASDVYALGVLLYELAASERPYPKGIAWQDRSKHKPPAVRHGWDFIVQKCLEVDPAKRYRDASEVATALEPSRALRRWLAAAAAIVLAAVSGLISFERARAPKETVRLAVLPFEASSDLAPLATNLARDAARELGHLKGNSQTRIEVINSRKNPNRALRVKLETAKGDPDNSDVTLHAFLTDTSSGTPTKEWTLRYKRQELRYAPEALAGMITSVLHIPPAVTHRAVTSVARPDYLTGLSYVRDNIKLDDAVALLERSVAADPDTPLTWSGLAEAQWRQYLRTRQMAWKANTEESVRQAELRDLDLPEVHLVSGLLKADAGFYEQAEADYKRAIELEPNNGDAHRRLGATYEKNGQLNDALSELQKAIEIQPNDARPHRDLGIFFTNRARYGDALTELQKMKALAPDLSESHYVLGIALENLGRLTEAERELHAAIRLQDSSNAEHALAAVFLVTGRNAEAASCYRQAIALGPETVRLWLGLGLADGRIGLDSESKAAFGHGLELAERNLTGNLRDGRQRAYLAYFAARLGNRTQSESEIAQALQLSPDDADTCVMAAWTYEALHRREQTINFLASLPPALVHSVAEELTDYPEMAELRRNPRFLQLLESKVP